MRTVASMVFSAALVLASTTLDFGDRRDDAALDTPGHDPLHLEPHSPPSTVKGDILPRPLNPALPPEETRAPQPALPPLPPRAPEPVE